MLTTRSLRSNLALSYAGIALLTAAVLGTILLGVLGSYYARAENAYLQAAAARIIANPPPAQGEQLVQWTRLAAVTTQTRVQVLTSGDSLIADSGSPREVDPRLLQGDGRGRGREDGDRLPAPLGDGIFGRAGTSGPRSHRTLTVALPSQSNRLVRVSEAPASGSAVLAGVGQAWILAAALAVLLAALVGYLVSSRISRPIVELTVASDRMAEGDLSARSNVVRSDEVGSLSESFNEMAERIETTVSTLRSFVADAAHEIGTPLTALQADLELAVQAAKSDDERRLVDRALGQARRLELLSANLLRLSRIEAGEAPVEGATVSATAAVAEAVEAVASRAEQAMIDLRFEVPSEPLLVKATRGELQTILGSLLDNALKFTPENGNVIVASRRDGELVVLSVADTGVGIPEGDQPQVFSRFHRGRNVAAYPGSGLGLAIVRATVERLGGTIAFETSSAGTTFTVALPAAA